MLAGPMVHCGVSVSMNRPLAAVYVTVADAMVARSAGQISQEGVQHSGFRLFRLSREPGNRVGESQRHCQDSFRLDQLLASVSVTPVTLTVWPATSVVLSSDKSPEPWPTVPCK